MKAATSERKPVTEEISGLIERVTFHNDESGFCVLRVRTPGHREETTVVGSLPSVAAGEWLVAEGWWVRDNEHGLQFKAAMMKTVPPTTTEGIERYVGSGLVKGIGPVLAKNLVERFGSEVLTVIENRTAELESVDGIGPKRRERIEAAWRQPWREYQPRGANLQGLWQAGDREGEHQPVHVGERHLRDRFRDSRQNRPEPRDSARFAGPGESRHRSRPAGSNFGRTLCTASGKTHTRCGGAAGGAGSTRRTGAIADARERLLDGEPLVFLPHLRKAEEGIAAKIKRMVGTATVYPPIDFEKAVTWCEQRTGKTLAPSQREAVRTVFTNRVVIITGGPGVGKTTLVNSILMILRAKGVQCLLYVN